MCLPFFLLPRLAICGLIAERRYEFVVDWIEIAVNNSDMMKSLHSSIVPRNGEEALPFDGRFDTIFTSLKLKNFESNQPESSLVSRGGTASRIHNCTSATHSLPISERNESDRASERS